MAPVTLQDTISQLDWLSDRISTQVRWFAAGVVALVWGLLVTPPVSIRLSASALMCVGLLAVSVLFADFLQYAVGFLSVRRLHKEILSSPEKSLPGFDTSDPLYQARTVLFWVKQMLGIATFVSLVMTSLSAFLK
jgi:hypothetical protein